MNSSESSCKINHEVMASRMKAGDEKSLVSFMVEFGRLFRGFFIWRGLSRAEAEDLAVDCTTDIALKIKQFDDRGEGSFKGWSFQIARNKLADWFRKQGPSTVPLDEAIQRVADVPEDVVGNPELQQAVQKGLDSLSKNDREILILRYFQPANTFAEIAQILGISEGATRVRHHRATKHLANVLERMPSVQHWLGRNLERENRL